MNDSMLGQASLGDVQVGIHALTAMKATGSRSQCFLYAFPYIVSCLPLVKALVELNRRLCEQLKL